VKRLRNMRAPLSIETIKPTTFAGRPILEVGFGKCGGCYEYITTFLLGGIGFHREWKRVDATERGYIPHFCTTPEPPPMKEAA
jgi:hypothetical protein